MRSHFKRKEINVLPKEECASDMRPQTDEAVSSEWRKDYSAQDLWNHHFLLQKREMGDFSKNKVPITWWRERIELPRAWSGLRGKTAKHCGKAKLKIIVLEKRWAFVTHQLNQSLKMQKVVTGGSVIVCILITLKTGGDWENGEAHLKNFNTLLNQLFYLCHAQIR